MTRLKSTRPPCEALLRHSLFTAAVFFWSTAVSAATYVVTNTNDNGTGSLRQAIIDANATGAFGGTVSGSNAITFTPALSGAITLQSALPLVFHNLTIDGSGANITIDGQNAHRGFFVSGLPHPSTPHGQTPQVISVELRNLTLQNCKARGGNGADEGGGGMGAGGALFINANATVTLSNVVLLNNSASGGFGGGSGTGGGGGGGMGGSGGTFGGAGGGGLGGNGGNNGGGGGIGGNGGSGSGSGGGGFGGTGIGQISTTQGFASAGPAEYTHAGGANGGGGGGLNGSGAAGHLTGQGGNGFGGGEGGGGGAGGILRFGGIGGGGSGVYFATQSSNGGFGGGGGASLFSIGGTGGFGGGGGAFSGLGGFGGGGGGRPPLGSPTVGHGGFGGGGGSGASGGFGGGNGSVGEGGGGGGGAGLGGAIFVVAGGSLNVGGPLQINGGTVTPGGRAGGTGTDGTAFGSGLFLQGSTGSIVFNPGAGQSITIGDSIADQTGSGGTGGNAASRDVTIGGAGTVAFTGSNSFTGILTVNGTLTTPTTVAAGQTLAGTGTVTNNVNVNGAGVVAPGVAGPGILHTNDIAFASGSIFSAGINGLTAGSGYDQLDVTGTVTLGGSTLVLSGGTNLPIGSAFTIINNDGADAIAGSFAGLPESGVATAGTVPFRISYVGGSGNDVTLTRLDAPPVADNQNVITNEDTAIGIALTATHGDPEPLTFAITVPPLQGVLTGTPPNVTYTPNAHVHGPDSFQFSASDGTTASSTATVSITITSVNDPPTFSGGPDITMGFGPPVSMQWATAISVGPSNESAQTPSFNITANSNPALFAVQPSISPSGVLSFTHANGVTGSSLITVLLSDGFDHSSPATFTITILGPLVYTVTNTSNSGPGSLRQAIIDANAAGAPRGDVLGQTTINFSPALTGTILLQSALPLIFHNLTIDGSGANITIDGQNLHRGFFVTGLPQPTHPQSMTPQPVTVAFINLTLAHCRAKGGNGGARAGGGGLGAGGALFVNSNASVTLSGITFTDNSAAGGNGGAALLSGGGGGGLGGNGGDQFVAGGGGLGGNGNAGGGGIGGAGGLRSFSASGAGGGGFGGTGIGQISPSQGFAPAGSSNGGMVGGANGGGGGGLESAGDAGHLTGAGGTAGSGSVGAGGGGGAGGHPVAAGGIGGGGGSLFFVDGILRRRDGGFGGGAGGGGIQPGSSTAPVGIGGFGGGGGAGEIGGYGGNGGFGGGGGAGQHGSGGSGGFGGGGGGNFLNNGFLPPGAGGFGAGGGSAADTNADYGGGGGAAMGGAIFVVDGGSVTISGPLSINGGTLIAGLATPGSLAGNGAGFGTGIFLQGNNGVVTLNPGTGQSVTISDVITDQTGSGGGGAHAGSRNITIGGAGTVTLPASNSYTGTTTVSGTLILTGSVASPTTVTSGGTIRGTGAVNAPLTVNSGGIVAPGTSVGTLITGNVSFASGSTFRVEVDGTAAGTYDRLDVTGSVQLGGATLDVISVLSGYLPNTTTLTIIVNDAGDAVNGTFNALPEGAVVNVGSNSFRISYAGGDGNDVTLRRANTAPVANAQSVTTGEEVPKNITLTGTDSDSDAITFNVAVSPANGVLSSTPPNVVYTPNANFFGVDSFTFTASDGVSTSTQAVVDITVNAINDAPSFVIATNPPAVNEDGGAQSVSSFASSISAGPNESQTVSFIITATGSTGGLTFSVPPAINASGTLTYTSAAHVNGTASFDVVAVDDGSGTPPHVNTSAAQSFTITVNAVNDAPSFVIPATAPASDEDSGAKTVPAFATSISAGPSNENGQTLSFNVSITSSSSTLTFSAPPSIDAATGNLTYTAAANAWGTATIDVTLSDSGSGTPPDSNTSTAQTFTITVRSTPDAPTFSIAANPPAVNEDSGAQTISSFATELSGGPNEPNESIAVFNLSLTGSTGGLTFAAGPQISNAGTLTYIAAANANGTATFDVVAVDTIGTASTPRTFTVTVNAVNDAPSFTVPAAAPAIDEDSGAQSVSGFATAISAGPNEPGQTLTFHTSISSASPTLTFSAPPAINATTGQLTYTPAANAWGSATISVTLSDDGTNVPPHSNTSGAQTFTITVNSTPDAPTFTIAANPPAVNEDAGAQTIANLATALSGGPNEPGESIAAFNLTLTGSTGGLTFAAAPAISSAGTLTYTATSNANGSATFDIIAVDTIGTLSAPQTFTITVNAVNDAPSFTIPASAPAVDEDGGAQSVTGFASLITAGPADEGAQTLSFNVNVSASDATLTFAAAPAIHPASGNLTYTPASNAWGTATISVTLSDNGASGSPHGNTSAPQMFTITVNPQNDTPGFVLSANPAAIDEDAGPQTLNGFLTAISPGPNEAGQTVTFAVTQSGGMAFSAAPAVSPAGTLTYTVAANANGTATFNVVATDNIGASSLAQQFTITVNAINDPPTFSLPANTSVDEDTGAHSIAAFVSSVSPGPSDESSQIVTFGITANDTPALFAVQPALNPSGDLAFTLAPNAFGVATLTVTFTDNGASAPPNGNTSSRTFTITVNNINDAPTASPQTFNISEDAAPFGITLANDVDGDVLTFEFDPYPSLGFLDGSGPAFTYHPNTDGNGTDTFTYTATDPGGSSVTQTVTINIAPVNDSPIASSDSKATDDDSPVAIVLSAYEPDNDPLTFAIVTPPTSGTLSGTLPNLIYTPNVPGPVSDSFTFSATDPSSMSSSETITITTRVALPQGARQEFFGSAAAGASENGPAVAIAGDGSFVVVWVTSGATPSILGQRFSPIGARVGSEFQVNTSPFASASVVRIAFAADGSFVVVWDSTDGISYRSSARRYASNGSPIGPDFPLPSLIQKGPDVATSSTGTFLVVGQNYAPGGATGEDDVWAQRYDGSGTPQGSTFRVNTLTPGFQGDARVSADAAGNFVVVWRYEFEVSPGSNATALHGRRISSAGVALGTEHFVAGSTLAFAPLVAMEPDGDFVVVGIGSSMRRLQRFDSNASPVGSAVDLDPAFLTDHSFGIDGAGNSVVTWPGEGRILGRRVGNTGVAGAQFRINSATAVTDRNAAAVAVHSSGSYVVAWTGTPAFATASRIYVALSQGAATALSPLTSAATALVGDSLPVSSTLTRTAAPAGPIAGATVTFTLSGAATNPGGASSATLTGTTDANGVASVSFPMNARGEFTVTAAYAGTLTDGSATAAKNLTVHQKTQVVVAAASGTRATATNVSAELRALPSNAPIAGQAVSFSFTGTPAPAAPSATTNASGVATVSTTFPNAGTFTATASFSNAAGFFADHTGALVAETDDGSVTVARSATTTTLVSSLNPSNSAQSVTFTATVTSAVSGTITGPVTFKDGATTIGTGPLASGAATFTTSTLAQGPHSITAVYEGNTNFDTSTSAAITQNVNLPPFGAPSGFSAAATSTTSVSLSWLPVASATSYEVTRSNSLTGSVTSLPAMAGTALVDSGLTPGTTYLYKVRAIGSSGPSSFTGINVATTIVYVDATLAGVTIKGEDVLRLRAAVNALRAAANLGAISFTDPSLVGQPIRRVHLTELRTALDQAHDAFGFPRVTYTDTVITQGVTTAKAAHWLEIRAATQ